MKRRLAALLFALCLLLPLAAATARADFGDYAGSYDYDYSYDYGYDYDDYDYGSGSSYYDDDDDDWVWGSSGTYTGGGYSGGFGGSGGSTHYYYYSSGSSYDYGHSHGVSDNGKMILGLMFLVIIVLLVIWLIVRSERRREAARQAAERRESMQNRPRIRPIGEYAAVDPDFSARELCERAANLYVRMQNAWTDKDISDLRPYFTDGFFTQMERSLEGIVRRGHTNYVERIAVMDVTPRGFHQTAGEDHVLLRLRARIVDYTVDDATGKVVSGHKDREKFMTYEWDLVRPTGVMTPPADAEGVRHINCPNCGAPLDINTSARCPYCGSVLASEGVDWAICAIHGISQQTM